MTLLIYDLKYNAEVQYGPNGVFFCRWDSVRADLTKPLLESLVGPTTTKTLRYRQSRQSPTNPYRNYYTGRDLT